MQFIDTPFEGVYVVETDPINDDRGSFARVFDADLFHAKGLTSDFRQHSMSMNRQRGTLRGFHYQAEPYSESKLVRCVVGAMFDVAVDIRRGSPSFGRWYSVELTAKNQRALYLPWGVAHGFQTLVDDTAVLYLIDRPYVTDAARGIAWNDPDLAVSWPILPPTLISGRDEALPSLRRVVADL